jgi:diadenosine tetraphosphate (Ap4A) HIT family hydrolase
LFGNEEVYPVKILPLHEPYLSQREEIRQTVAQLQEANICPTCHNFAHGDVYPPADERLFYEDELLLALLEDFPRNPGHSIILLKPHYEDISELPPDIGTAVYAVMHRAILALKEVFGAVKVYMCTMCDGQRNHLHFQLIPRLPGDAIRGSRLFVKERGYLAECSAEVAQLRALMGEGD